MGSIIKKSNESENNDYTTLTDPLGRKNNLHIKQIRLKYDTEENNATLCGIRQNFRVVIRAARYEEHMQYTVTLLNIGIII